MVYLHPYMISVSDIIFYILVFLSVYGQVFYFVTFLENRKKIITRNGSIELAYYPSVTVVMPCWNEESTVEKSVLSLLNLNYPKDKLKIFLIDDGSTDDTWNVINKFTSYSNIEVFHKENGGKHSALNLGLEKCQTEFFGCLDADSFADSESLVRIMSFFEKDSKIMAVAPSIVVSNPKTFVQNAQKAEYHMGVFLKKMLGFIGGINVTPGPLTIFKKKVFDDLGGYRHGHNTEDMEIAFRMQKNHYKIDHCNDAYVYTNTPGTFMKLYTQRLRWIYGFINNTIDYRSVLFRKKYGNFATFTLPLAIVSTMSVSYLLGKMLYSFGDFIYQKVIQYQTVGFSFKLKSFIFDPFFINVQSFTFLSIVVYALVIFAIIIGRKMSKEKNIFSWKMLFFFPVFGIVAPLGIVKGIYNTILRRKPAWR